METLRNANLWGFEKRGPRYLAETVRLWLSRKQYRARDSMYVNGFLSYGVIDRVLHHEAIKYSLARLHILKVVQATIFSRQHASSQTCRNLLQSILI